MSLFLNSSIVATNMVSTLKKKHKKLILSQLNDSFNDFVIGNITIVDVAEKETEETQTGGLVNNFGRSTVGDNGTSHDQVIE